MATWRNRYSNSILREGDVIDVMRLDHAKAVSDFIRIVDDAVRNRGYKALTIDFSKVDAVYPNAAVPIAGILYYYQKEQEIDFNITNERHITKTNLLNPLPYNGDSRYVLNRVWSFETSEEVARMVNAFIEELQKSAP